MNIALWVLQVLLALHTVTGALWKFSNSPVPSLQAIPQGVWLGLSGLELLCAVALVVPALYKPLAMLVPIAAGCIAAEMLIYCVLNLSGKQPNTGEMIYWLVVAGLCGVVVYGRLVLSPLLPTVAQA
jgi:hypothetical protein